MSHKETTGSSPRRKDALPKTVIVCENSSRLDESPRREEALASANAKHTGEEAADGAVVFLNYEREDRFFAYHQNGYGDGLPGRPCRQFFRNSTHT